MSKELLYGKMKEIGANEELTNIIEIPKFKDTDDKKEESNIGANRI